MKLLKTFTMLFALVATATACDKPIAAELNLLNTNVSVDAEGGKAEISFTTNQSWSIRSDSDWVTTLPISGIASTSSQKVTLTVAANPTESERTATLTVTAGKSPARSASSRPPASPGRR